MGAVSSLEVPKGRAAQALLAIEDPPANRTAFVSGELRFERKLIPRGRLEAWRSRPDYQEFKDF